MADFLLELGCEEIPAGFLPPALKALNKQLAERLAEAGLKAEGQVVVAGTPRRLAAFAPGIPAATPEINEEKQGPGEKAPDQAVEKFAASLGLTKADLVQREVKKGKKTATYWFGKLHVPSRPAGDVLAELIPDLIEALPFKKSMRWVPGSKLRFARPLRSITALLDGEVVPASWAEVRAGRTIVGHRFLFPEPVELERADWASYLQILEDKHVLADPQRRREVIKSTLLEQGLPEDELAKRSRLIEEVADLVEWPLVDAGHFSERFLELPALVIQEAMVDHQRYFPVPKGQGELENRFLYVANRPYDEVIRRGNERVLQARLEDALFFFRLDLKTPLDERVDDLEEIVFMAELGTLKQRIARIDALALEVAEQAGWIGSAQTAPGGGDAATQRLGPADRLAMQIHVAARLARTDLTTEVVQEFNTLQGEMGAIYARLQDHEEEVAEGIREAYLPRGEGDDLPRSKVGIALALADKLDTIAAAYATGRGPTGSKDPFQVRRAVLGILRTVQERQLDLGTQPLIERAVQQLPDEVAQDKPTLGAKISAYVRDRLEVLGREQHHVQLVRAALDAGSDPSNVLDFWSRLEALTELSKDERFARLCELVERSRNITDKNGPDVDPADVDTARLDHPAEKALHEAISSCRQPVRTAIDARRYAEAGRAYVDALAEVTHTFFEPAPTGVFVMDEDPRLRTNRLALLKQVHGLLAEGFADLAKVDAKALAH